MISGFLRGKNCRAFFLGIAAVLFVAMHFAPAYAEGGDEELVKRAGQVLGPLPRSMPSEANPITREKVQLGKMLFYESRISIDKTVSCAKCHPIALYSADGLKKAVGNHYKENPRNSPAIFNAGQQISQHWIGNRSSVEDQARQSVTGPAAYGMPSNEAVEKILRSYKEYGTLFRAAFPEDKEPVTVENFGRAVGAFERTLITPAPFDAFLQGSRDALSSQQKKGLTTFLEQGCAACHNSPYLGGQMYMKFGMFAPYAKYTKSEKVDEGRFAITKDEGDRYVFKVPGLRNVAMTPPYFHDGSVDKLEEAVWIMGKVQLGRDLGREQVEDIASFLRSLTGEVPPDALTVPLLPSGE